MIVVYEEYQKQCVTCFAILSNIARSTGTDVSVIYVVACSSILAWRTQTFVDICKESILQLSQMVSIETPEKKQKA